MFKPYLSLISKSLFISLITFSNTYAFNLQESVDKIFGQNLPYKISILHGGLSSPGIYKIETLGSKYVLKLFNTKMGQKEKNRMIFCQQEAAKLKIAPQIEYIDQNELIISKYAAGQHLSKRALVDKKLIPKLASTLLSLHQISTFPETKDIFTVRRSFEKKALQLNSSLISAASKNLSSLDDTLRNNELLAATHNDLKPENIIFDKEKFIFIDWEAAGQGYPSFDIATIFVFYNFSNQQQDQFLKQYFKRAPTISEKARIELFKYQVLGYYGMAYLMLSVNNKLESLTSDEVENLPRLSEFLEKKSTKNIIVDSYGEAQKLGWILIKELNYNKSKIDVQIINYQNMLRPIER